MNKKQIEAVASRLRATILDIRRKPYPISDLIPMLAQSANTIEELFAQYVLLQDAVETMRVSGGSLAFQAAYDKAKDLVAAQKTLR